MTKRIATPDGSHPLHDLEELLDLAGVEARRRLVEDQHLGIDLDGAGDRDELLHGDRVRLERRRRIDVEVQGSNTAAARRRIAGQLIVPNASRFPAEHRVLGDREVRHQVDLLVHGADPGSLRLRRTAHVDRLAASRISPESARYTPVSVLISVDLPAPFSPSRACTSPGRSRIDTSSRARTPGNDTVIPRISTVGGRCSRIIDVVRVGQHRSASPDSERRFGRVPKGPAEATPPSGSSTAGPAAPRSPLPG